MARRGPFLRLPRSAKYRYSFHENGGFELRPALADVFTELVAAQAGYKKSAVNAASSTPRRWRRARPCVNSPREIGSGWGSEWQLPQCPEVNLARSCSASICHLSRLTSNKSVAFIWSAAIGDARVPCGPGLRGSTVGQRPERSRPRATRQTDKTRPSLES